jgi:N utilization substance protein A
VGNPHFSAYIKNSSILPGERTMKKEFALAFAEVLEDKQLPQDIVVEALEAAMVSAYRKTVNASSAQQVQAKFDLETGEVQIFAEKEVVDDVQDERTEVTLKEALKYDPDTEIGNIVIVETTPDDFGRVAAQTARQVIQQRIREAERDAQFEHFQHLAGEVVNGVVQAINSGGITLGLDRKAEGVMPRSQQIRGERFRVHDRVRALLLEVKNTPRGPQLVLSRAHKNFLRRLLEDEVPEIYHGLVEIRSIAREPGYRSKVAVSAMQPGIDPVGACVGIRGVRIQAIVRELNDEKIDVIEWNPDPSAFIAKALSPARVTGVYLDESSDTKTATVVVPEDQLSLAIGRDGQNARLAAKLTSWRIDIKSLPEAAADALFKIREEEEFAEEAADLADIVGQIEMILKKKDEGRAITPEEYQMLARFVTRVETGAEDRRQAEVDAKLALEAEVRGKIPNSAFDIPLDDLGISPRLTILLTGEGYSTIGDLMIQLAVDPDAVLALNGVGPKAMEDIQAALDAFEFPEPEIVEPTVEEVAEVPAAEAEFETVEEQPQAEEVTEEPEATAEELSEAVVEEEAQPVEEEPVKEEEPEEIDFESMIEADKSIKFIEDEEEDEMDMIDQSGKPDKKKKKRFRQVEYDPDLGVDIVRRRRKGDEEDWDTF